MACPRMSDVISLRHAFSLAASKRPAAGSLAAPRTKGGVWPRVAREKGGAVVGGKEEKGKEGEAS